MKYRLRDLKAYASKEVYAGGNKAYRSVFFKNETGFVYAELSFVNLSGTEWTFDCVLKAIKSGGEAICEIPVRQAVSGKDDVVYIREGWGTEVKGGFWECGEYRWEAWKGGKRILDFPFYIESGSMANEVLPLDFRFVETENQNFGAAYEPGYGAELVLRSAQEPVVAEVRFSLISESGMVKDENVQVRRLEAGGEAVFRVDWPSVGMDYWNEGRYRAEARLWGRPVAALPVRFQNERLFRRHDSFFVPNGMGWKPSLGMLATVEKRLEDLVGLDEIKTRIQEHCHYLELLKLRKESGDWRDDGIRLHCAFLGGRGTGKSTVAAIVGTLYRRLGLLSRGHLVVVGRSDLVGEFTEQTEKKTREAIESARGGVLFIKDAHLLYPPDFSERDQGVRAIECLVRELVVESDDWALVVAGFPKELNAMLNAFAPLKSHLTQRYFFADYGPEELLKIAENLAEKKQLKLQPAARDRLLAGLTEKYRNKDKNFANAILVGDLVEEVKRNMYVRVRKEKPNAEVGELDLTHVRFDDVEAAFRVGAAAKVHIPIDEPLLRQSLAELNDLTGLSLVKRNLRDLVSLVQFQRETHRDGVRPLSLHSVFTGNPGTGKTTVARLLADLYKALGLLERGHLVEVQKKDLVAGYVGQTAQKTADVIESAMGGVLFIDEAYALADDGFGAEAIATLVKYMDDHRSRFYVIVAGYERNMERFIQSNPGLRARFDHRLHFPDYSAVELFDVARNLLRKEKLILDPKAQTGLRELFEKMVENKGEDFGNAREARKVFEALRNRQNLRVARIPKDARTEEDAHTVIAEDLGVAFDERPRRKSIGFVVVPTAAEDGEIDIHRPPMRDRDAVR